MIISNSIKTGYNSIKTTKLLEVMTSQNNIGYIIRNVNQN